MKIEDLTQHAKETTEQYYELLNEIGRLLLNPALARFDKSLLISAIGVTYYSALRGWKDNGKAQDAANLDQFAKDMANTLYTQAVAEGRLPAPTTPQETKEPSNPLRDSGFTPGGLKN